MVGVVVEQGYGWAIRKTVGLPPVRRSSSIQSPTSRAHETARQEPRGSTEYSDQTRESSEPTWGEWERGFGQSCPSYFINGGVINSVVKTICY